MQDRYAGDLGDFLKFSLLRQLRGPVGLNAASWRRLTRLFLIGANLVHREVLEERLRALTTSVWREELRVIWRG
jgi:hypothetical protein